MIVIRLILLFTGTALVASESRHVKYAPFVSPIIKEQNGIPEQLPLISNFIAEGTNFFFRPNFIMNSHRMSADEKGCGKCKIDETPVRIVIDEPGKPSRIVIDEANSGRFPEVIISPPIPIILDDPIRAPILPPFPVPTIDVTEPNWDDKEPVVIPTAPVLPPLPELQIPERPANIDVTETDRVEEEWIYSPAEIVPVNIPEAPEIPAFPVPELPTIQPCFENEPPVEIVPEEPSFSEVEVPKPYLPPASMPVPEFEVEMEEEINPVVIPEAPILPPFEFPEIPMIPKEPVPIEPIVKPLPPPIEVVVSYPAPIVTKPVDMFIPFPYPQIIQSTYPGVSSKVSLPALHNVEFPYSNIPGSYYPAPIQHAPISTISPISYANLCAHNIVRQRVLPYNRRVVKSVNRQFMRRGRIPTFRLF